MKGLVLVSLLFLSFLTTFSQQAIDVSVAPDLKIIKNKCYLAIREIPGDADSFKALRDQNQARIDKIDPEKIRRQTPEPLLNIDSASSSNRYIYELKVKNTGQGIYLLRGI